MGGRVTRDVKQEHLPVAAAAAARSDPPEALLGESGPRGPKHLGHLLLGHRVHDRHRRSLQHRHVAVEALNSLAEAVRVLGPHLAPAQQEQVGGHHLGWVQRLASRRGVRQVQLRLFGQDRGVQRRVHLGRARRGDEDHVVRGVDDSVRVAHDAELAQRVLVGHVHHLVVDPDEDAVPPANSELRLPHRLADQPAELVVLPGEELGGRPRANGGALKVHEAHDHPRQARLHRAREKHAVHVSFLFIK
mmetsp:Transcript_44218/g.99920  ORF Transcript_44218/g.99920 Transcript_44218/m.99920 type:complete len:247 (-) Transcript_44218:109-849(-)